MVTSQAGHVSLGVQAEKELNKPPPAVIHHGLLPRLQIRRERNTQPRTAGGMKPEFLKTLWKEIQFPICNYQLHFLSSFTLFFFFLTILHSLLSLILSVYTAPKGSWQSGFFDQGSFMEIMQPWAQSVVVGRAR